MGEQHPVPDEREITAKDVFARSNMPSRWERLTNVAPKTSQDRKYLAFVAARYRGEKRLPLPEDVESPEEISVRQTALCIALAVAALGLGLALSGAAVDASLLMAVGVIVLIGTVVVGIAFYASTQSPVRRYHELKVRCAQAERRLQADTLDEQPRYGTGPQDTSTLNKMITCDEGTLAYCAAKIASEIEQDPRWRSSRLDVVPIDLRDELAEVGESARLIHRDRKALRALEAGRLRDDPEVRVTIAEDKAMMKESLALLAARISAFADYRDHVQRLSMHARRDSAARSRTVRRVIDEQAANRPL